MTPRARSASANIAWTLLVWIVVAVAGRADAAAATATTIAGDAAGAVDELPEQRERAAGICAMDGCNCTVKAHHWVFVKCAFDDDQDIELSEGMIPEDTMEVEVTHCRELRIQAGAFSGGAQLKRVHVSDIYTLVANRQAFQNIVAPNPLLEVSECNRVVLESHAFRNTKGPLSVAISRCRHVVIKPNAFSWLLQITVKDVPNLELSSNAFKFESPQHGRHGPATKIMFQSVKIPELPTAVFPSTAAEIRMDDLWTGTIKKDAFCAMNVLSVTISNASIVEIEPGAFSDRTLIHGLEFVDVRMKVVRAGAFRAGANNLTIQYSRLSDVETGAIDITVATVTFNNNEFHKLRKNSIAFHQWNRIAIDYNLFQHMEAEAIAIHTSDTAKATNVDFSFSNNHIHEAEGKSLSFIESAQNFSSARISSNYFKKTCNCNLQEWIGERVGSTSASKNGSSSNNDNNVSLAWIYESSYCVVDKLLRNCFDLPEGYLSMSNYTMTICSKNKRYINCTYHPSKTDPNAGSSASPPNVGPHQYPRQRGYFDVEMSDSEQLEREKFIIIIVCITAVISLVIVIFTSGCLYMRRRGVCPKLTSSPLSNMTNSWFGQTSGMTAATSARSISRLSVHEYAGLQNPETRVLDISSIGPPDDDEDNDTHEVIIQEDDEGLAEAGSNYAYSENKATQTLPEELTADYLNELKEKLYDPDNYNHTRAMIEHLYDLINVEESCNNNYEERRLSTELDPRDNTYDVIKPRVKRTRPESRTTLSVNVGTKAPSLEKLLPNVVRPRPQLATDYAQPRDQRIIDQNHLYTELPNHEEQPVRSRHRLSQTGLTAEAVAARAPQPLPPDVVVVANGHRNSQINESFNGLMLRADEANEKRVEKRPSYLFGNTFGSSNKAGVAARKPNSYFKEYADDDNASEATTHLYAELPEPKQPTASSSSSPANKMANRPLPTKPDQKDTK